MIALHTTSHKTTQHLSHSFSLKYPELKCYYNLGIQQNTTKGLASHPSSSPFGPQLALYVTLHRCSITYRSRSGWTGGSSWVGVVWLSVWAFFQAGQHLWVYQPLLQNIIQRQHSLYIPGIWTTKTINVSNYVWLIWQDTQTEECSHGQILYESS